MQAPLGGDKTKWLAYPEGKPWLSMIDSTTIAPSVKHVVLLAGGKAYFEASLNEKKQLVIAHKVEPQRW